MERVYVDRDLEEIIPQFLENRKQDIERLRRALYESDFSTVKFLGHNMKGSGSGYGFHEVSRIGLALEEASAKEETEEVQALVDELESYMGSVEIVYQ